MYTLALVGGLVALGSHFFWVRGIWNGSMHLNIATWLLWSVIDMSVLLSSLAAGAPAPFLSAGFVAGAILVTITLLVKGDWQWTVVETVSAVIALVCLGLWYVAGPVVAVVSLTLGKYCVAGVPTLVSAYQHPERAQSWVWWLGTFGAATNIFAAGSWTLAQSFFPTVALIFTGIGGLMHLRRDTGQLAKR